MRRHGNGASAAARLLPAPPLTAKPLPGWLQTKQAISTWSHILSAVLFLPTIVLPTRWMGIHNIPTVIRTSCLYHTNVTALTAGVRRLAVGPPTMLMALA